MPHTFTRSFRVRYYECDPFGHLSNPNYLRYTQESAFDASAEAGFSRRKYEEMGRIWVIRQSEIEYLKPLWFDDCVEVRTWVADFRRATSRRQFELTRSADGELMARGFSDWVFLNRATGHPALIPPEVQAGFFPEGIPQSFPSREPFPPAPPPPSGVFTVRRRVGWHDLDPAGHVNNAMYLNYADDCGFQAIAAFGWPVQRMLSNGVAILIRKNQVQYLQAARLGDELEVATWVSDVRRSSAVRHYTIRRAANSEGEGELLVRVLALGMWVDLNTYRPTRIPEEMLSDFAANIAA